MARKEESQSVTQAMFTEIKNAYLRGEITDEEYARIRSRLISSFRSEVLDEILEKEESSKLDKSS